MENSKRVSEQITPQGDCKKDPKWYRQSDLCIHLIASTIIPFHSIAAGTKDDSVSDTSKDI